MPAGHQRKTAIEELQRKTNLTRASLTKWIKSSNNTTVTSFVAAQEIVKGGKPFTDGEYVNVLLKYLKTFSTILKTKRK